MNDRFTELAKIWLEKAKDDFYWARDSFADGYFGNVCFICQQIAEKALKSYLFSEKQTLVRTHHLPVLNAKCKEFDKDFSQLKDAVNTLTNYYTDTRYPDIWDYSRFQDKKLAEEALKFAEQVLNFISERIKL